MKIRQQFTLLGTCSDPYEGQPIAALAPQYFICEAPSFANKDMKRRLKGVVGKNASLSCNPNKGVPTPTAKWTKAYGTLNEVISWQTIDNYKNFSETAANTLK